MNSSQLIAELSDQILYSYCSKAISAIILQEYLLTFSSEVEVVWKRKLTTFTSILFLLNRYITLFTALFDLAPTMNAYVNHAICGFSETVSTGSQLVLFFIWAVFSALRVFSVGNRNKALTVITFGLGVVPFLVNMYPLVMEIATSTSLEGRCIEPWVPSRTLIDILEPVTRVSSILSDCVVLYVTLSNAYSLRSNESNPVKSSLFKLLVKDGTLYFLSLLSLNCIQLVLWITNTFRYFSLFITSISSIIISRFILDLREIFHSSTRPSFLDTQYSEPTRLSTVQFTSIEAASLATRQSGVSLDLPQPTESDEQPISPMELHQDTIPKDEVPGGEKAGADDYRTRQVV